MKPAVDWTLPPYINAYRDRHGTWRFYYRRKGYPRVTLPSPDSPEFAAAYDAAGKDKPRAEPSETFAPGTFKALCHEYEHSAEFKQLAESTRRETRYVLNSLVQRHGANEVAKIKRHNIRRLRDELKDKPGAANKMLRVLKVLMAFAVERDYIEDNPTTRIKLMRLGEHRAWTKAEMEAFENRWPLGSLERTGYALALYTGQRRADIARLKWASVAGNSIKLTQEKTATVLVIPIHPELSKSLLSVCPRSESAIVASRGKPLSPVYFGHLMARAIEDAGLPDDCVLHGLRKSAAVALIDAGCTPHQTAAITGHKTAQMLELYARRRDQEKLGKDAMRKWKRAKR